MSECLIVAKVGGSLFDLPDLAQRLRSFIGDERILLFPGGGPTADAVRALDRVHGLGEEASHWLALRALSLNAHMLARLLPDATLQSQLPAATDPGRVFVLDPLPFFETDDREVDRLPHCWEVTSDSLAVRVAARAAARELVLLKSVDWPQANKWEQAMHEGIVDGYFAQACREHPGLAVHVVNLRGRPSGGPPR